MIDQTALHFYFMFSFTRLPRYRFPNALTCVLGLALSNVYAASGRSDAFQASGIKLSEPTSTGISIRTRVTQNPDRVNDDGPLPITRIFDRTTGKVLPLKDNEIYLNGRPEITFPPGVDLGSIRGATPGAAGQTRVRYRSTGSTAWLESDWREVEPESDFTAIVRLDHLTPKTRYELEVEARPAVGRAVTSAVKGGFVTAPGADADSSVSFCVMTCQQYEDRDRPDGFSIYPSMLSLNPDFFINTGDAVYYDHGPVHALNLGLARYHWARVFGFATLRDFHRQVGSYFMKDDHDVLGNDCGPGSRTGDFTFENGLSVFHEQTALPSSQYRTVRWGKHLQIWMVEGRDFRTAQSNFGTKDPSIWGAPQIAWLERTLAESDATFRILVTSTPIVGPDRSQKDDNYSNAGYATEGAKIRVMLGRVPNLTVITGDRHWQYVSVDPTTQLEEWSVGAASDSHAGGWSETTPRPMHRFLRTKHGGFLSGEVRPGEAHQGGSTPTLTLRLHDTGGKVLFESQKRTTR